MNTSQLECFVSLAATLNYAKTAEQVFLTQPAVSKQIQSLETELGAKLFVRSTRFVNITDFGIQFLPEAQSILNIYYKAKNGTQNLNSENKTSLRIGYSDPNALGFISDILKFIKDDFPNFTPEFFLGQTDSNLTKLSNSQIDIVVGIKDLSFNAENIIFRELHKDGFRIVLPKNHPLAIKAEKSNLKSLKTEELAEHKQIVLIPQYLRKNFFAKGNHVVPVNEKLQNSIVSYTAEAYSLVKAGFGFSFVPEHLSVPDSELVILDWENSPRAPFGIYSRKDSDKEENQTISAFIEEAEFYYEHKNL